MYQIRHEYRNVGKWETFPLNLIEETSIYYALLENLKTKRNIDLSSTHRIHLSISKSSDLKF